MSSEALLKLSESLSRNVMSLRDLAQQSSSSSTATGSKSGTSTSDTADLFSRAEKLRKSVSQRQSSNPSKRRKLQQETERTNDSVLISVCGMEKTKSGLYSRRNNPYYELECLKSDSYIELANKAASKTAIPFKEEYYPILFKVTGSMIKDEEITIQDNTKPWTFGRYLQQIKKAGNNLKLGVDIEQIAEGDTDSSYDSSYLLSNDDDGDEHVESRMTNQDVQQLDTHTTRTKESGMNVGKSAPCTSHQKDSVGCNVICPSVIEFKSEDIIKATNNFNDENKLGTGGFGTVLKGHISGSYVAIKVLAEHKQTPKNSKDVPYQWPSSLSVRGQLSAEVNALSRYRHTNLLELMGFCNSPPCIVYQYMENGSLYDWLHKKKPLLDWNVRAKILKGVCQGLAWMHGTTPALLHGDVKSNNVLLDKNFVAKLGDFGLAREMPMDLFEGYSMVTAPHNMKSLGYGAPEMDSCRHSPKTDVYAYGILTLECVSGELPYDKTRQDHTLAEHFEDYYQTLPGFKSVLDPKMINNDKPLEPYLLNLLHKIVNCSIVRHSKRSYSQQLLEIWQETNLKIRNIDVQN